MGVTPGWGGAGQLVDIVGKREALKILASSKKIHPNEALNIGLVDEIIPDDIVSCSIICLDYLTSNKNLKFLCVNCINHEEYRLVSSVSEKFLGTSDNPLYVKSCFF